MLCWYAARRMVGRAALFCGPPHGGTCCAGAWLPPWWGVLCWCLSAAVVVPGVVVPGLGCHRVCRLAAGVVGLGLVVLVVVFELVLFVQCCLRRLTVGLFGLVWSAVGLWLWLC